MVSVIVPVHNVKPYLEEAIESIIYQSYKDLEIILIDDGSTDGSGEICDEFEKQDNRIKVIHQRNRGLSAARNVGLDICSGEYIIFLDSDDAFCKDYVEKMLESLQLSRADIVECDFAILENKHRMNEKKLDKKQKFAKLKQKRAGLYSTKEALNMHYEGKIASTVWNKIYKKNIWSNLRFCEGQNFEDIDIILPILEKAEKICIIDDCLVMRRRRKGSIMQTVSLKNIRDKSKARQHYWEFIVEHTPLYFNQDIKDKYLERWLGLLLIEYYSVGLRVHERGNIICYLSNQIRDISQKIDIKHCKPKVRGAYFLYCHIPLWIATIIYRFFRFGNNVVKMVSK